MSQDPLTIQEIRRELSRHEKLCPCNACVVLRHYDKAQARIRKLENEV